MIKTKMISIIMPLYNSEQFIITTIESIIFQSYKNWELIIVNDCSTDDSVTLLKNYIHREKRIKLINLKKNSGGRVDIVRNKAIKEAKGKYIAFLDSDDLWHPQKLEKQLKYMEENNYNFTFTKYQHIAENGQTMEKYIEAPKTLTYRQALLKNPIGCLTVMYNAEKLGKKYMPFAEKREDYACWLKILKLQDGYGLNENLAYYRRRKNSFSSQKIKMIKYQWKLYKKNEELTIYESTFYLLCVIFQKLFKMK